MTDKKSLLYNLDEQQQILFAHIYDLSARAYSSGRDFYSCFLSENECALLKARESCLPVAPQLFGGYGGAMRNMAGFVPEYIEPHFPISAVAVTARSFSSLSHRDFLGSLMSLGIKREKCGDIVISENCCYIFLQSDIAEFVKDNLVKVKNTGVSVSVENAEDVAVPERKFVTVKGTVASLRLDAVLSLAVGKGRGKCAEYIQTGRVFVDGVCTAKPDMHLQNGCTLTVRGVGKMLVEVSGNSKKGRIFVTLNKFA